MTKVEIFKLKLRASLMNNVKITYSLFDVITRIIFEPKVYVKCSVTRWTPPPRGAPGFGPCKSWNKFLFVLVKQTSILDNKRYHNINERGQT